MYTFRAMTDDELVNNYNIKARGVIDPSLSLLDLLKTLNGHVKKGGKETSPWISISSDFLRDVERYNMPVRSYNEERKKIAIIINNDKTDIITKHKVEVGTDLLGLPVSSFRKVIMDYSSKESINEIKRRGLTIDSKGKLNLNYSRTHGSSLNDSELLVYKSISGDDIVSILGSLDIDLLYCLIKSNKFSCQDDAVAYYLYYLLPLINRDPEFLGLSEVETKLFEEFYQNDKHLVTVVKEILRENFINYNFVTPKDWNILDVVDLTKDGIIYNFSEGIDILNIFAYLKRKKRIILERILALAGITLDSIHIPEDVMQIVRIGNVYQDGVTRVFYKGEQLFIPKQSFVNLTDDTYRDFSDVSIAFMHGNTELLDDNLYWLTESDNIALKHHYDSGFLEKQVERENLKVLKLNEYNEVD